LGLLEPGKEKEREASFRMIAWLSIELQFGTIITPMSFPLLPHRHRTAMHRLLM